MDVYGAMRTFRQVVASEGFAAAARQLGRATSSVSRQIAELENELGVRLFHRTTRQLSLTEAGQIYHERAVRILDEVDEARLAVASEEAEPSGVLRVAMPTAIGREIVALALPGFLARHPAVRVVLSMSDLLVDMVDARVDVAIRVGRQKDSALIARKIGESRRVVCASPAYLEQAGTPKRPADLEHHNCLTFRDHPGHNIWSFLGPEGTEELRVSGNLFARSADALAAGAVAGLGLILLPDWNIGIELRSHRLRAVLADYEVVPAASPIYAVYPPSPYVPPKVRAFVDFLRDHLRTDTHAEGGAEKTPTGLMPSRLEP
ncbi:MAG: LysR family transcriptional regulator [Alphaproteobacteria bacterium]